jgi:hypothetical protein
METGFEISESNFVAEPREEMITLCRVVEEQQLAKGLGFEQKEPTL